MASKQPFSCILWMASGRMQLSSERSVDSRRRAHAEAVSSGRQSAKATSRKLILCIEVV